MGAEEVTAGIDIPPHKVVSGRQYEGVLLPVSAGYERPNNMGSAGGLFQYLVQYVRNLEDCPIVHGRGVGAVEGETGGVKELFDGSSDLAKFSQH